MIPVTDIRARESFCFMRWSKSSWGFFRWVSCSLFFISYQPFHSPCSCISRSPGSAERACGASPWQRWPPCWCPAHLNAFSSPRGKSQNISYSIEDIQYYVLFNIIAGPEAVLRQPLEDMKVFWVSGGAWVQPDIRSGSGLVAEEICLSPLSPSFPRPIPLHPSLHIAPGWCRCAYFYSVNVTFVCCSSCDEPRCLVGLLCLLSTLPMT